MDVFICGQDTSSYSDSWQTDHPLVDRAARDLNVKCVSLRNVIVSMNLCSRRRTAWMVIVIYAENAAEVRLY